MIKNNECKIRITTKNKKYYNDINYKCVVGDIISIDVSLMSKKSKNTIIAICEICKNENSLSFVKYNINFNRGGFYSCKKCSSIKRKKTTFEKYGVEFISQLPELREKQSDWMSSNEFRTKSIKTQIDNHGSLFTQTDDFKLKNSEMRKNTIKKEKKDGTYKCALSLPENNELKKNGMISKYGHTCSFLVPDIKYKIQMINLEKFGHISPLGNKEIQTKIKENIIYKSLERECLFNGDKYKIDLFRIYRRKVRYETDKIRKILFESWDGLDYYDGEYIKNNTDLHRTNSKYPSIDHKISCFYGFINDIPTTEISKIDNLCITKRIINSRKGHLNEDKFIEIINLITLN